MSINTNNANESTQSTQGQGVTPVTGLDFSQQFSTPGASGGSSSGRIGTFPATELAGNNVSSSLIHQTLETVQQALHTMSSPQRGSHERSFHGQAVHYSSHELTIQTCQRNCENAMYGWKIFKTLLLYEPRASDGKNVKFRSVVCQMVNLGQKEMLLR